MVNVSCPTNSERVITRELTIIFQSIVLLHTQDFVEMGYAQIEGWIYMKNLSFLFS